MKEIEVSDTFAVSADVIEELITPESIIEYEGTFQIKEFEDRDGEWLMTVTNEAVEEDIDTVFRFIETDAGYRYEQVGQGLFASLETEIEIDADPEADEDAETAVTHRSRFTFGGAFAFLKNWLAADLRQEEAERFLINLRIELDKTSDDESASTTEVSPSE